MIITTKLARIKISTIIANLNSANYCQFEPICTVCGFSSCVVDGTTPYAYPQWSEKRKMTTDCLENDMINKLFCVRIHFRISKKHICIVLRKLATSHSFAITQCSTRCMGGHIAHAYCKWMSCIFGVSTQSQWTMNNEQHYPLPYWQP